MVRRVLLAIVLLAVAAGVLVLLFTVVFPEVERRLSQDPTMDVSDPDDGP